MSVLKGLKPEKVFAYFEKLCAVPHGSGNTQIISDLCVSLARELGLKCRQEECGNVVIWKPASPGCESAEPIILQGHMDMVCAKTDDCTKDMAREGLDLMTDGEWVWADKTSLGGDNCIAVAMILAILSDDTLVHPPIEAVFTVSCAGGMRSDCFFPAELTPAEGMDACKLTISGLRGGHSGADIHLGRGSANRLMGRVLCAALEKFPGLRLAAIDGGEFDNVICSRCEATVALPAGSGQAFAAFARELDAALKNEYAVTDPGAALECVPLSADRAVSPERTAVLLRALAVLPHGVEAMDTDFPGLVQTSLNMGVVRLDGAGLHVTFSIRSSIASRKEMLAQRVRAAAALAGGTVTERGVYPGWQYRRDSEFRETLLAAYKDLTGKDGVVEATHGGLECGLLMEKLPGLDAVSLGPDIPDIHSVRERLGVSSVARTYALVCEVLRRSV